MYWANKPHKDYEAIKRLFIKILEIYEAKKELCMILQMEKEAILSKGVFDTD